MKLWLRGNRWLMPLVIGAIVWVTIAFFVLGCAAAPARGESSDPSTVYDPVDHGISSKTVQLPDGTTVQCVIYDPVGSSNGAIWCR